MTENNNKIMNKLIEQTSAIIQYTAGEHAEYHVWQG